MTENYCAPIDNYGESFSVIYNYGKSFSVIDNYGKSFFEIDNHGESFCVVDIVWIIVVRILSTEKYYGEF